MKTGTKAEDLLNDFIDEVAEKLSEMGYEAYYDDIFLVYEQIISKGCHKPTTQDQKIFDMILKVGERYGIDFIEECDPSLTAAERYDNVEDRLVNEAWIIRRQGDHDQVTYGLNDELELEDDFDLEEAEDDEF